MCVRDILLEKRSAFNKKYRTQGGKRVYYLSIEYLIGRSLENNLHNLGLFKLIEDMEKCFDQMQAIVKKY